MKLACFLSLLLPLGAAGLAPQYSVTSWAGTGNFGGDLGPATAALLYFPSDLTFDAAGNLYIADTGNNRIRRVDASTHIITTIAGNGLAQYSGDGGPALAASLNGPTRVLAGPNGNLFILDAGNNSVREVNAAGIITTVAGTGNPANPFVPCTPGGDGGLATSAVFCDMQGLAMDSRGNLYVADGAVPGDETPYVDIVREFAVGGKIMTIAGTIMPGDTDGPVASANFGGILDLAVDSSGDLYVLDYFNRAVRKIGANGTVSTVIGNISPTRIAEDPQGTLYLDALNQSTGGVYEVSNGAAVSVSTVFTTAIAFDSSGALFGIGTVTNYVEQISGSTATLVAGGGRQLLPNPSPNQVVVSDLTQSTLAMDSAGNQYFIEELGTSSGPVSRIDEITPAGDVIPLFTTSSLPTGSASTPTAPFEPLTLAVDPNGVVYFTNLNQIYRIENGIASLFAGIYQQTETDSGNGGPALRAGFSFLDAGMVFDAQGNLYVSEPLTNVVRMIDTQGAVSIFAGTGRAGYSGDSIPADESGLNAPGALAVDSAGDVFIVDTANDRIREVTTNGIIATVAGNGSCNSSRVPANASAADVGICLAGGISVDASGGVFFPAFGGLVLELSGGLLYTVAGTPGSQTSGSGSYTGAGGPALSANLGSIGATTIDRSGNIYLLSFDAALILKLTPATIRLESAASYSYGALAAGSIATALGSDLATSIESATATSGVNLAGTTLSIKDSAGNQQAAPLFYVAPQNGSQPSQVNFALPAGTAPGNGTVTVKSGDGTVSTAPILVSSVSPALFTLNTNGLVAAYVDYIQPDNTQFLDNVYTVENGAVVPKPVTVSGPNVAVLELYGTGIRNAAMGNVSVTVGGVPASVGYAGLAPGFTGEDQVNITLPASLAGAGNVPIILIANEQVANTVTIAIQ